MAILQLNGISKNFGAIQALDGVSLDLHSGEILGLMGDNGAGKSTLVKIVAGNYPPSDGAVMIEGRKVAFHKPAAARSEEHAEGNAGRPSAATPKRRAGHGRSVGDRLQSYHRPTTFTTGFTTTRHAWDAPSA